MLYIVNGLAAISLAGGASTVAYPACFAACVGYFANGVAVGMGASGAATSGAVAVGGTVVAIPALGAVVAGTMGVGAACAAACTCFDVETTVETIHGTKFLASVRQGDEVLTVDENGKPMYTRVVENPLISGTYEFRTFTFDNHPNNVTVTDNHPMCLAGEGKCQPLSADQVIVGQKLALHSGAQATVANITSSTRLGKYALMTETCTVLANGVVTGTVCMDTEKWAATGDANARSKIWSV